jgi:hypothetical protein
LAFLERISDFGEVGTEPDAEAGAGAEAGVETKMTIDLETDGDGA